MDRVTDRRGREFIILWGGTDISPDIYSHPRHNKTQRSDVARDLREVEATKRAMNDGIPIIGVCRGAQMLCALNGGTLYQHTEHHNCDHPVHTATGVIYNVAAGHHQVMNPRGNFELLGWDARPITVYEHDDRPIEIQNTAEVVFFPDTKSIAIQPHPEWMKSSHPFNVWINSIIEDKLNITGVF